MSTAPNELVLLVSDNVWNREGKHISALSPSIRPVVYHGNDPIDDDVLNLVDIAFFSSDVWPDRSRGMVLSIMKAPQLKWLHTFSAGVDSPFFIQLMERGVRLTNSSGATASPIAQTAILYMLALSRNVRAWFTHQDNKQWQRHDFNELDGARLGVIGMGPIGYEIARLGVALNMEVEAIRRTPVGDEPCPTFGFDQLDNVLSRSDWVCVALPLTDNTKEIFNSQRFAQIKPGAHFINVGRGELVNEDALVDALQSHHLAGAALDVFATEPLPVESPLWQMPNVIVTPHSSGASHSAGLRSEKIFVHNVAQYLNGLPMTNEVTL